jgi:hypothetical protein
MDYYKTCSIIRQVQIVWSDQVNSPPHDWLSSYPKDKYVFEVHKTDSLSNRFRALGEVPTEVIIDRSCHNVQDVIAARLLQAVLSIDDDLIVPCEDLANALRVWDSNKR